MSDKVVFFTVLFYFLIWSSSHRVHSLSDLDKWNRIAIDTFPSLSNRIQCFAYDWLGRQFVLDFKRKVDNEPMILMLEVGTGEILEIPCNFKSFHEEELIEYQDAAIATEFFNEWIKENGKKLEHNNCVGYKIPLFLGGKDSIENLEVSDMEVYWGIVGQLIRS